MDGIHDLGGKHGHGAVDIEENEPVFHARWEAAVFAMTRAAAAAGAWNNTDMFRHGVERIDPVAYLSHGYYGRWLGGMETLLVEAGLLTQEELTARALSMGGDAHDLVAARPQEPTPLAERAAAGNDRPLATKPTFAVGDIVLTSTEVVPGHTRLPAYARGKRGEVSHWHDGWVFPDSSAHGEGEHPQHLYTVRFTGTELWGGGDENITIYLDLFEPYLSLEETRV